MTFVIRLTGEILDLLKFQLDLPRVLFFKWSPNGDQLATFHQYYETKNDPNPGPNVIFWSIPSGEKMGSFMLKGTTEGWEPFWTEDSNFIVRKIGDQLISFRRAEPTTGIYAFVQKIIFKYVDSTNLLVKFYICNVL